ncbi:MAG TPA: hypothetical protein VFE27_05025 [Acidobacteriaceae bacterium]|jgi:hypothetical protein|nr:hypothetical protein [Acidobacteriaceae bacterium]
MKTNPRFLAPFVIALSALALAQDATNPFVNTGSQSSPVAYLYVSSSPSSGKWQINAYSASSSGKLTPIVGSPFSAKGGEMALTSKWFFTTNGIDIYTSSISSTGALKPVSSINAQKFNSCDCGGPATLFLDHTGATLYDWDYNADGGLNNAYQSFDVDHDTGKLSYTGATSVSAGFYGSLSFVANNEYAYGGSCYHGDPDLYGFSRSTAGTLTDLNLSPPIPATAPDKGAYCPGSVAANPTNQIAVPLTPDNDMAIDGPTQLGVFTAGSSGNLTTTSTYKNMPATNVGSLSDVWASPSGLLLAVAGENGLEVFHYNGAKPITKYTGLLTTDNIVQVFWDSDNHLYALAAPSNQLLVFTVTPTSFSRAPGSPYTIANPAALAVLPQ